MTSCYDDAYNHAATQQPQPHHLAIAQDAHNNQPYGIHGAQDHAVQFDSSVQEQYPVSHEQEQPQTQDVQEQVVPATLDHLSREELCQMVFRLDYERNSLKRQLQQMQEWQNQENKDIVSNKRIRNSPATDVAGTANASATNIQPSHINNAKNAVTTAATLNTPTAKNQQEELAKLQKRLSKNLLHAIKTTVIHGGRKMPQSTCIEGNVDEKLAIALMSCTYKASTTNGDNAEDRNGSSKNLTSNTKRMIKWLVSYDRDIASILNLPERLVHPVKHDGTGQIFINPVKYDELAIRFGKKKEGTKRLYKPPPVYNWAKFVRMEVRYDKRDKTLTVAAKTTDAGSGRPEFVKEKVGYSMGEREDFPQVHEF
mmetsp:Transcript_2140/g.4398  ORF Transcript_2140/g.4398 Transcript_2140/m.4398 type:complete len:369 (-) Transcript_2140:139-1245(-)